MSNAEVAITKHGDAMLEAEQVGQKYAEELTRQSGTLSSPRNNQGGHELVKSTPKNTRLQLTMQISLSQV
ncbi:hypothetical protein P7H06_25960 [Paenibacillus larvae]|nr:hypothetical protein [Paenibacillus larvae]MDT2262247.1 hypothetical protein [Paenibacillus larvae]